MIKAGVCLEWGEQEHPTLTAVAKQWGRGQGQRRLPVWSHTEVEKPTHEKSGLLQASTVGVQVGSVLWGNQRARVQAQWRGELGALKPDRAGAQPADIIQGWGRTMLLCQGMGWEVWAAVRPGPVLKGLVGQAEEFRPYMINCDSLGPLDCLIYKMRVHWTAIRGW